MIFFSLSKYNTQRERGLENHLLPRTAAASALLPSQCASINAQGGVCVSEARPKIK